MWPAFWSFGDPWPQHGEIDIMEARGNEHRRYQTNYFYDLDNVNVTSHEFVVKNIGVDLTSCYHIYAVEWTEDALRFYLDGVLVHTKTGGDIPKFFGLEQHVVFNLAVGGDFFAPLTDPIETGTLYVDWITCLKNSGDESVQRELTS